MDQPCTNILCFDTFLGAFFLNALFWTWMPLECPSNAPRMPLECHVNARLMQYSWKHIQYVRYSTFTEDTHDTLQLHCLVVKIGKTGTARCVLTHVLFHATSDAKQCSPHTCWMSKRKQIWTLLFRFESLNLEVAMIWFLKQTLIIWNIIII